MDISISCVENNFTDINHAVSALLKSKFSNYSQKLDFSILNEITKPMPSASINRARFVIPNNIALAHPEFHKSSEIDIHLGVQLFYKLMCIDKFSLKTNQTLYLQKTQLGWIIAGELKFTSIPNNLQCNFIRNCNPLDKWLTKFWEIEEIPTKNFSPRKNRRAKITFKQIPNIIEQVNILSNYPSIKRKIVQVNLDPLL